MLSASSKRYVLDVKEGLESAIELPVGIRRESRGAWRTSDCCCRFELCLDESKMMCGVGH